MRIHQVLPPPQSCSQCLTVTRGSLGAVRLVRNLRKAKQDGHVACVKNCLFVHTFYQVISKELHMQVTIVRVPFEYHLEHRNGTVVLPSSIQNGLDMNVVRVELLCDRSFVLAFVQSSED